MSEHSAEFVLVSNLAAKLRENFGPITPVFYWATREGNNTAHRSMGRRRFRVISAFARRPRVTGDPTRVGFKINEALFEYAAVGENLGMPVLAGIPLVSALSDFVTDTPCAWVRLLDVTTPHECYLQIDPKAHVACGVSGDIPLLRDNDVVDHARRAKVYNWEEIRDNFRTLRRNNQYTFIFRFLPVYRPFHLLLPEDLTGGH